MKMNEQIKASLYAILVVIVRILVATIAIGLLILSIIKFDVWAVIGLFGVILLFIVSVICHEVYVHQKQKYIKKERRRKMEKHLENS